MSGPASGGAAAARAALPFRLSPSAFRTVLIDTHCHLYHEKFDADRDAVLDRARAAGVGAIVMPAIDVPSIHAALALAHRHADLFVMAALHPTHVPDATDADLLEVEALARDPRVVAVGESGLDRYWSRDHDARQDEVFRVHVRLAAETGKPLVLHTRSAEAAALDVLDAERPRLPRPDALRGIFHCFSGDAAEADRALAHGFLLGLGGTLTFKNGATAAATAHVPLGALVLETDAPFLAPEPHRGQRNEPAYVALVARRLATLRGVGVDEVAAATTATARALFGLPPG